MERMMKALAPTQMKDQSQAPGETRRGSHLLQRRLSREQAQAQTRARLLAVGREHFVKFGLGGAVAEKIAEEAGYSRGALYSNFDGKEELFVAVMQQEHQRHCAVYEAILRANLSSKSLLKELRTTYINMLVDPDWVMLWADFQSEAVRNANLQERYRQFYDEMAKDVIKSLTEQIQGGRLLCRLDPASFVLAMESFAHGLAMRQRVLGIRFEETRVRKLIGEVFDTLITIPG